MEKFEINRSMLEGEGSRVLYEGIITDEEINFYGWGDKHKELKFVVCKGYINDWCIYLESMEEKQSYEGVKAVGNKLGLSSAEKIIKCERKIWGRYRL